MTAERKPNLVLGAIRGYNFNELRPFVCSLQRTEFKGELVLFWNKVDDETREKLAASGVRLHHMRYRGGGLNSWSRFWPAIRPILCLPVGSNLRRVVYDAILNLAVARYLHALDFLRKNYRRYGAVLFTDVRDVIFQDDPFRDPLPGEITAFLEEPFMRFGQDPTNDEWLTTNYGADMFQELQGQRISCCGTVMGSASAMLEYFEAFISEIIRLHSVAHGADTSVHNVLTRSRMADRIAVVENFSGAVGTCNRGARIRTSDVPVLGPSGKPVPILHQYDRHAELASNLLKSIGPNSGF